MDLLETAAKSLLARAGVPVSRGGLASSPHEAVQTADRLGGPVVVKAQVPSGGRGKAGGVLTASSADAVESCARRLIGSTLGGFQVANVLVEEHVAIARELYVAFTIDPTRRLPVLLFSPEGGVDIEATHADAPSAVRRWEVDVRGGLSDDDVASWLAGVGSLTGAERERIAPAVARLYQIFSELDCELLEVNPLALTTSGNVLALDCKLSIDDAARPRQGAALRDVGVELPETGTELERRGRELGLSFIELEGDVGLLANGAGLTMATMDAISHYGGRAANFLEIGGDAYTKGADGLRLVLSNPKVNSLVVNFCGAFARTDVMIAGVVSALEDLEPGVPISFAIRGTGEEDAAALLRDRLGREPHDGMESAVKAAVEAAATAKAGG